MKYFIKFRCPIIEVFRSEELPEVVYATTACQVKEFSQLVEFIDEQLKTMIRNDGIVCWKDEATAETPEESFEKRLFVPMHMITHISMDIKPLVDSKGILDMRPITIDDVEEMEELDEESDEGDPS